MIIPSYSFIFKRFTIVPHACKMFLLLFTPTSRTPLRGVERTCKTANASLPCHQAYSNAGKPLLLERGTSEQQHVF